VRTPLDVYGASRPRVHAGVASRARAVPSQLHERALQIELRAKRGIAAVARSGQYGSVPKVGDPPAATKPARAELARPRRPTSALTAATPVPSLCRAGARRLP
jgi:hypothetical protein